MQKAKGAWEQIRRKGLKPSSQITQILHPDLETEMETRSVIGLRLFCSEERMEREPGAMKGL